MTYQADIKPYKIIGLVVTWPVIMSKLCTKVKDYFKCFNEITFPKRQLSEYKYHPSNIHQDCCIDISTAVSTYLLLN
jgi:hypothetical protein